MFRSFSTFRRIFVASVLLSGLGAATLSMAQDTSNRGRKYKAPPPTALVVVTVLRATTGKPVENASVIFHPLVNGKDSGNMELKTNDDGKATIDLLTIGSNVRVQVIAPGFQTYGEDYKIDKDKLAIEVKLHRPAQQYSVYKKDEGTKADADKAPEGSEEKTADKTPVPVVDSAPKDAAPEAKDVEPAAKDASKPSDKPQDASTPK